MTKTQKKDLELHNVWCKLHQELHDTIRAEFPVGTNVKYRFGQNWIFGVVAEIDGWDLFGAELKIKNTKTGTFRNVKGKDLEFDTDSKDKATKKK